MLVTSSFQWKSHRHGKRLPDYVRHLKITRKKYQCGTQIKFVYLFTIESYFLWHNQIFFSSLGFTWVELILNLKWPHKSKVNADIVSMSIRTQFTTSIFYFIGYADLEMKWMLRWVISQMIHWVIIKCGAVTHFPISRPINLKFSFLILSSMLKLKIANELYWKRIGFYDFSIVQKRISFIKDISE